MRKRWSAIIRLHVSEGERIDPRGLGTQLYSAASPNQVIKINAYALNLTGDDAPFLSYDERFEHPARTWASSSHRKFTHAAVGIAMAAATFRFTQATAKTAMRRVLGVRGGQGVIRINTWLNHYGPDHASQDSRLRSQKGGSSS